MTLRVYVDFNTMGMDEEERVLLNTAVYHSLVDELRPGLPITLWDETLEVEAMAEFDEQDGRWWGKPDWSTSRDVACYEADTEQRLLAGS